MFEPKISPSTRAYLERIDALPINAAGRSQARVEFEHAEVSATRLVGLVDRMLEWLLTARQASGTRRQRLG